MYSINDEPAKSFNELQADILGEKITNNPKMKESKILSKNKALKTPQKTIINAINEILESQQKLQKTTNDDLSTMYSVLGNFGGDATLVNELISRGAETILALVTSTYDSIQEIKDLAKDDYEDAFNVPDGKVQSEFKLTHRPIGKIRIYIDGIRYFKDCIEYDAETNTVKWINDASKPEGFDITDSDVVFEYDYSE